MLFNKKGLSALLLAAVLIIGTACGGPSLSAEGNNVSKGNWIVEDFTFINQDGEAFGLADLEGKVWLADFIFTNCTTVCLPMSTHMSQLQDLLEKEGLDVPIVSFTVDPDRDSPEVLKEYGEKYGANFETWQFLTGYEFEEIKELSEGTFKSIVGKPQEGDDQYIHGVLFYLIQSNQVIKAYNGVVDVPFEAIIHDAKVLSNQL